MLFSHLNRLKVAFLLRRILICTCETDGRYYNNIITDVNGFQAWWETVAAQFASNSLVMFDTNNEC